MQSWIIFALLSAISASLVAIFGKIGVKGIDTTLATAVRAIIMAVFLSTASLFMGKFHLISTISNKVFLFIVLSGIAGAISWLFYFLALSKGPAAGVAALDRLSVVFVVVFSVLILGDKLNWQTAIGALFITTGAIFIVIK
jgi:bacterial/archaeal transporter family protein